MYSFADDGSAITLIHEKALPLIYLTHLLHVISCTFLDMVLCISNTGKAYHREMPCGAVIFQ